MAFLSLSKSMFGICDSYWDKLNCFKAVGSNPWGVDENNRNVAPTVMATNTYFSIFAIMIQNCNIYILYMVMKRKDK